MNNYPIGVFDSGLGGISVWKELTKVLPDEDIIYYADSANCPYGEKSPSDIIKLSTKIVSFLLSAQCKLIVLACNTATAAAVHFLRENYEVLFVGMEPAIKPAALQTKTGKVGVLATKGTLNGGLYKQTKEKFANGVEVYTQIGHGLVELVEQGKQNSAESLALLRRYIQPMIDNNIDQLVLGCTHYPFFIPIIEEITQGRIQIINASPAVARRVKHLLKQHELEAQKITESPRYTFYTSGETSSVRRIINHIPEVNKRVRLLKKKLFHVV